MKTAVAIPMPQPTPAPNDPPGGALLSITGEKHLRKMILNCHGLLNTLLRGQTVLLLYLYIYFDDDDDYDEEDDDVQACLYRIKSSLTTCKVGSCWPLDSRVLFLILVILVTIINLWS